MKDYVTISVRRIAVTALEEDVQRFFSKRIGEYDPFVRPLVTDTSGVSKATTVSFRGKSKAACLKTIEKLEEITTQCELYDGTGTSSTLALDPAFLGLTLLSNNCADDEEPYFDVYFVHGLGGHAYNSFRTKPKDHRASNMWARDTLPRILDRPGKKGRYFTFGYPAPLVDSGEISQSVYDTARSLLRNIKNDRGEKCKRPIFFICHSLGGLVVCQATLLAMESNNEQLQVNEFRKAFSDKGESLIKGIVFFGTPFRGSRSANVGVKIATGLKFPLNKTHVMYLRVKDKDVATLVNEFDKRTGELDIPLLIFYELEKTQFYLFREKVVGRESAIGPFSDRVPKIALLADHHKLVKFKQGSRLFEKEVEPEVRKLVHSALDLHERNRRFAAFQDSDVGRVLPNESTGTQRPRLQALQKPGLSEMVTGMRTQINSNSRDADPAGKQTIVRLELRGRSGSVGIEWVDETIRILDFNHDKRQLNDIVLGSVETCDWILSKPMFQTWRTSSQNSVMFIQGGPGLGKSVLAKFIVQSLADHQDQGLLPRTDAAEQNRRPIVVHFFPRGRESVDKDNSPKAILMHVLYQIWEAEPESLETAISKLVNRFNQSRNLDFYWTLFNDVRNLISRNLYCIIDGLDECIRDYKSPQQPTVDRKMEGFLVRLCDIARETAREQSASITKILVTTRPTREVGNATLERNVVLEIQETDTTDRVKKFIQEGVDILTQHKHLSIPTQDFIKSEIIRKAGHVFQTAQNALTKLQYGPYDLEDRQVVSRALERIDSKKMSDAYQETLELLEKASIKDQVKAASIIRILFFVQGKLSLDELNHALLVEVKNSEPTLRSPPLQNSLDVFIRSNLALLIKIDEDGNVKLEHQTVREYFQGLSSVEWPTYSCANKKAGHLNLALICIRYLVLWRHQDVTEAELEENDGNEDQANCNKSGFLSYATYYWDLHVREAAELIEPYIPHVDKALGLVDISSFLDYIYMLRLRLAQGPDATEELHLHFDPPETFLAYNNLVNVLRAHTRRREQPRRSIVQRLQFWKARTVTHHNLEFDLNLHVCDQKDSTPLHRASENGCIDAVELLLDCGADGNVYNQDRHTPFSLAVQEGWTEIAEMLITRKQCFDDPHRSEKVSTLHAACLNGMPKVVQHLLQIRCDANARVEHDWTPVHVAAQHGQTEIMGILLDANGAPDAVTSSRTTPLHLAAANGHLAIVEMLFREKPDLDPCPLKLDGQSPHHGAARNGHFKIFRYLLDKASDIRPDEDGLLPIHLAAINGHLAIINFVENSTSVAAPNKNGKLPIHIAAVNGHLDTVKRLLHLGRKYGVSIDVKCKDLSVKPEECSSLLLTPLYLAVCEGHQMVAKFLIDEGADIHICSFQKRTLLYEAARSGVNEVFEILLRRGLDPFAVTDYHDTPLFAAAELGKSEIVDIYLKMDNIMPQLDMVDDYGLSALFKAISSGNAQIAEKLISKGVNVHTYNLYRQSNLSNATILEDLTVFKKLLEANVEVQSADVLGWTALHSAVCYERLEACKLLIGRGADKDAQTDLGSTPLIVAAERFNVDIFKYLLEEAQADPLKKEIFGNTVFDYVKGYAPILVLLQSRRAEYTPLSDDERINILQENRRKFLSAIPLPSTGTTFDAANRVAVSAGLCSLSLVFMRLEDYDAARVCIENGIRRSNTGEPVPSYVCDNCKRSNVVGSFWICKQCPQTAICCECYEKRSKREVARGCSDGHDYLELGGEDWRKFEKGKVNARGQTLREWLIEMKNTYCTDDEAQPENASHDHEETTASSQTEPQPENAPLQDEAVNTTSQTQPVV